MGSALPMRRRSFSGATSAARPMAGVIRDTASTLPRQPGSTDLGRADDAGDSTLPTARSPARMINAAGARSHWPRQGERCQCHCVGTADSDECAVELVAQICSAPCEATGDVVANVNDGARLRLGRER